MTVASDHAVLEAQLRALTTRTLSPGLRYFHVAVLLAALIMCALLASLLLTEPGLPTRTQLAFVAMTVLATAWAGYAGWVLVGRSLLADQRRVAGWMAVTASALFLLGCVAAVLLTGSVMAMTAAAGAATMLAGAGLVLASALRSTRTLRELKARLEAQIR